MNIKDIPDEEFDKEIKRRANIKHQGAVEARREEQRIYDLPENIKARKMKIEEARYQSTLGKIGLPEDTYGVWSIYGEDPNCDLRRGHQKRMKVQTVASGALVGPIAISAMVTVLSHLIL